MENTKTKIKVIHVIPTLRFGGAERLIADIAQYHNRELTEVIVVTVISGGAFEHQVVEAGVKYVQLHRKGDYGFDVLIKLWRFFREERPDIVHTHLFGADIWGKLAALLARVKVIISTEHNTWYDESWFRHKLKWVVAQFSDKIIAISQAVAEYTHRIEGVSPQKLVVIKNGIALDQFLSVDCHQRSEGQPVKLISIGRLEEQKGFDVLLDALAQIREKNWELTIVGGGSLLSDLEDRVRLLGLEKKVQFFGTTEEVPTLLSESDVFVLASRWEGLGLVVMEAMAAGVPIVATQVGGIPELIQDGITGYTVDSESPDALAAAISFCIDNPEVADQIGAQAREYAGQFCNVQHMIAQYEALYTQLVRR